jgi:hypothetical protein
VSYDCRKLDRFSESEFWADSTLRPKSRFWQNFTMISSETLNTKVADNELNFPLVTHTAYSDIRFGHYGHFKSDFSAELISDGTDKWVNFYCLRPKKRESWWGLSTDLAASLLSLWTPTQSHDSDNHNNGYDRPKTALVWSSADHQKSDSSTALKLGFDFRINENYNF